MKKYLDLNKLKNIFKIVISLGVIVFIVLEGIIIGYPKYSEKTSDYILVLGAGLVNGQTPSLTLKGRLDAALECTDNNKSGYIVVSGGKGNDERLSEALAMKNYLVEKGFQNDKIILEDKSTNTYENFKYSKEKIEKNSGKNIKDVNVKIVTTDFHAFRSSVLAKRNGYDNFENYSSATVWHLIPIMYTREAIAIVKSLFFDN